MSIVIDHVSQVDGQLDRLQLLKPAPVSYSPELHSASDEEAIQSSDHATEISSRMQKLQTAVKTFSAASSAGVLIRPSALSALLEQTQLLVPSSGSSSSSSEVEEIMSSEEHDLEWLLVGKAATHVYGAILELLLEHTIPLSSDIGYWNEVLGSYQYTGLYTIQTSPLRLWEQAKDIFHDAQHSLRAVQMAGQGQREGVLYMSARWSQFWALVRDSTRARSLADVRSKFMSPVTMCRMEAKSKRTYSKRLREMSATGLGLLMDEALIFDVSDEGSVSSKNTASDSEVWRSVVSKSVTLMGTVLLNVSVIELGNREFEDIVFSSLDDDSTSTENSNGSELPSSGTARLAARLQRILQDYMPAHVTAFKELTAEHGRPSRLVRYWLPGLILLLSSSTILRLLVNRKADIVTWFRNFGITTIDFWNNWVVEPIKKVIGTIRHDKDSEIALMSRESLQGDRASLERMVVEFATDNPGKTNGTSLTDTEIADVRAKVKEGDLTPVLKAYERDLRSPFWGSVRGNLIRALLIQVQKTKVDVEVAIGGIDNLLKSQELVFGFVGLTPGILVCLAVFQWLGRASARRTGRAQGRKEGNMIRSLRNIDRILAASSPSANGVLTYKEHGMLLCEVHILRQRAQQVLPGEIKIEFLEDVKELVELRMGLDRQFKAVERIRWAYSKWLQY